LLATKSEAATAARKHRTAGKNVETHMGNAAASLALVTLLIEALVEGGKLTEFEYQQILDRALASLPAVGHKTGDEARKIFKK
jgi:hypothetical protein